MRIRESAVARGIGLGVACLQPSATSRVQTMVTAYSVGHALDPKGFQLVSVSAGPDSPAWQRLLLPALTSGAAWTALHSALVPLARRSKYPLPLVAVGYAAAEALVDSLAADWVHSRAVASASATPP